MVLSQAYKRFFTVRLSFTPIRVSKGSQGCIRVLYCVLRLQVFVLHKVSEDVLTRFSDEHCKREF